MTFFPGFTYRQESINKEYYYIIAQKNMTLADIKNRIYFYTNTDSAQLFGPLICLLPLINAIDEVHAAILEAQDGWAGGY
jgi:hypothetical protein